MDLIDLSICQAHDDLSRLLRSEGAGRMSRCWPGFHQYSPWRLTYTGDFPCEATKTCERCGYVKYGEDHNFVDSYLVNEAGRFPDSQCSRCKCRMNS